MKRFFALVVSLVASTAAAQCTDLLVDRFDDAPRDAATVSPAACVAIGGGCTLRAALQTAGTHPGCDRVVLGAGTYLVTRPLTAAPSNLTQRQQDQWRYRGEEGALTVLTVEGEDTIVDGDAQGRSLIVAQGNLDRVFQVSTKSLSSNVTLATRGLITLRNLTFRGGRSKDSCGGVELSTCFDDPIGPTTTLTTRSICRYPTDVHLKNVVLEDNQAVTSAGGLCMKPTAWSRWNFLENGFAGNVVLMNVTLRNNVAGTNAGGLEYSNSECSSLVVGEGGAVFTGNQAGANGGGLLTSTDNGMPGWLLGQGPVLNQACPTTPTLDRYRGAPQFRPFVDALVFTRNRARSGGGAYFTNWSFNLSHARFDENEALENGGGLAVLSYTFLYNTGFSRNHAGLSGGGVWISNQGASWSQLEHVTIVGNSAGQTGGGLWYQHNPPSDRSERGYFLGVVIADNRAGERGGGLFVAPSSEPFTINRSFIADNEVVSSTGQGDNVFTENQRAVLVVRGSAFRQRPGNPLLRADSCSGPIASAGTNADESNTCALGPTDLRERPLLASALHGPLMDAGADVYGRVAPFPLPGSPLVDGTWRAVTDGYFQWNDSFGAGALDGDRDGVARFDIGGVELPSVACSTSADCQTWASGAADNAQRSSWRNVQCIAGMCRACAMANTAEPASCTSPASYCTTAQFCGECLGTAHCAAAASGTACVGFDAQMQSIPSFCGCFDDTHCGGAGRICDPASRRCVDGCRAPTVGCGGGKMCLGPTDGGAGLCGTACADDAGCSGAEMCRQQSPRVCVECEANADCAATDAGTRCVSMKCVSGCVRNADCSATQHCSPAGVCVTGFPFEPHDAGVDAGEFDGGVDAGVDAGTDAGVDGGDEPIDAGIDAGVVEPEVDSGVPIVVAPPIPEPKQPVGCSSAPGSLALGLLALVLRRIRRRAPYPSGDRVRDLALERPDSADTRRDVSGAPPRPDGRASEKRGEFFLAAIRSVASSLVLVAALTACDGGIVGPVPLPPLVAQGGGAPGGGGSALGGGGGTTVVGGGAATGGGVGGGGVVVEVLGAEPAIELRRLTAAQVRASVEDVFGPRFVPSMALDADETSYGLTSIGSAHATTGALAAELYFRFHSELVARFFADASRRQAFVGAGCVPQEANDPCVRAFFARLGKTLWRRPLEGEELDRLVTVVATVANASSRDLWLGLQQAVVAMLVSPNFQYRVEVGTPMPGRPLVRQYDDWELASRLSFTLWDSVPDATLVAAAEQGRLHTADDVRAQARRMLADPRGRRGVLRFFAEHLEVAALEPLVRDSALYPSLPDTLPASMRTELMKLVEDATFREGAFVQGRFLDLLDTNVSVVNGDLQRLYGLPVTQLDGGFVTHLRSAGDPRGGILGTAAFLTATSKTQRTSPTLRGRFIRERVLCETVANPPADVNAMFETITDGGRTFSSLAERLEQHSTDARCSGCHRQMDPLGLGLERFDAVGALIDAGSPTLRWPDGGAVVGWIDEPSTSFSNAAELGRVLKSDPRVARCMLRQSFRWVLGRREATQADVSLIDSVTGSLTSQGDLREGLIEFLGSEAFRTVPNQHTVGASTCAP